MKYLSVCSGIEAATVAWHPLGWTPIGFSEIEPFPSAVLAHHYPHVTNYGDMTNYETWSLQENSFDLLVGGTPCQSFSVAGMRGGLRDPRGGLMLTYLEIAQRYRPRWIVWENVPGVLSSNGGRDFGSFLGALGKLGYGWAYRVLDAQWIRTHGHPRAVPQRRRRVFVVGCLGDSINPGKVLFESQSLQGNSRKSTKKGKAIASSIEDSIGAEGKSGCYWNGEQVAVALTRKGSEDRMPDKDRMFAVIQSENIVIPYRKAKRAQSNTDDESWVEADNSNTLNVFDNGERDTHSIVALQGNMISRIKGGPTGFGTSDEGSMYTLTKSDIHGVSTNLTVRRLTPRECERLQGFPDDYTLIPWRGKPQSECPDSLRYRALGNSMAVNCMEWIGERIQKLN